MKLINADKYQKDIEHYRNTICYQRNVTMDDCMRILYKQEDVLDKIRAEIEEYKSRQLTLAIGIEDLEKGKQTALEYVLAIFDKYMAERSE